MKTTPEQADIPPSPCPSWFFPLTYLLLAAAHLTPIWSAEYFPTQNGPSLLLTTYMAQHLTDPDQRYGEFYESHLFPIPYLLEFAAVSVLLVVASPLIAQKIWISIVVLLRPLATFYFLRSLGSVRVLYGLACFPLIYDFSLLRGYFNYHAGVSIGLIVLGFYIRHRSSWTRWSVTQFNALILLNYFTHPAALAVFGLLLAAYEFAVSRSPLRILQIVARGYLPSIFLLVAYLTWSVLSGAWEASETEFGTISDKIQNLFYRGGTPVSATVNALSLSILFAIVAVGIWQLVGRYGVVSLRNIYINPMMFVREPILLTVATAVAIYIAMPSTLSNWHKADIRVVPIIFMLALAIPVSTVGRRAQILSTVAMVMTSLVMVVPIARGVRGESEIIAEYVAGAEWVPRGSKILAVMPDRELSGRWRLSDGVDPLKRADSYYALLRGGATGNSLAKNRNAHVLWYRDDARFPGVASPEDFPTALEEYDAVLLWSEPHGWREQIELYGFEAVFSEGRLTVLTKGGASQPTLTRHER